MTGIDAMFDPLPQAGKEAAFVPVVEGETDREREEKLTWVKAQLEKTNAVDGTPAEKYLTEHRALQKPFPDSLRWAPRYQFRPDSMPLSCLLSVVTNDKGDIVAIQSLQLDVKTGAKARKEKPDRFSNGYISEGTVSLGIAGEPVPTLVIGEGVETVLTRALVSPCDAHACLGHLRYLAPKKHHKRVEIIADTDKRDVARRLAREYAEHGLSAFVVTVGDHFGDKGDLNDALLEKGLMSVRGAVEDAESVSGGTRNTLQDLPLDIGSDIEIAQRIIERLEDIYGSIVNSEGRLWRFDRAYWVAFENDHLARFIHRADGAEYVNAEGQTRIVRLNRNRVSSILDAIMKYRKEADYFKSPPRGINCQSGFIQISDEGSVTLHPHARRWRQRHVVNGRYPVERTLEQREGSNLARYLKQTFAMDADAGEKVMLLAEVAGCAATCMGTKLGNPKAIVAFSEEGGTGKSTFLHLLRAMPNAAAVASVPANKFGDEKYAHRLIGKVLNASDELPDRAIKSDVFKRMVTGEPVPARDVYCSATDFYPVALHVFSTNVLPGFSGGMDGGTARRLLPIEFCHVVPETERDPGLADRIVREEADLLLDFAVQGACRLVRQKGFTIPSSSKELLNRWLMSADQVRAWAAERAALTDYENIVSVALLYQDFLRWAETRLMKKDVLPSVIAFGKRLPVAMPGLERHRSDGSHYKNVRLKFYDAA